MKCISLLHLLCNSNKMFLTLTVIVLGIFGQMSIGVPLEGPSENLKSFFDSRIVGGHDAGPTPHAAALVVGIVMKSLVCGASIITEDCLLTAAHCVTPFIQRQRMDGVTPFMQMESGLVPSFHSIVGSNSWSDGGTPVFFSGYEIHPHYDQWLIKNDTAVLKAAERILMSERVAVIGLNFGWVGGGEESYVTGWGTQWLWGNAAAWLQQLDVTTMTPQQCEEAIRQFVAHSGGWALPLDAEIEICTFHSFGHGMCHGDSGSALVSKSSGLQIGIVSWGAACAVGAPDVFVRVSSPGMQGFIEGATRAHH